MSDPRYQGHFKNGQPVRLNRTPFSEQWEVVQVDDNGLVTWRAPIHDAEAEVLEHHFALEKAASELHA